MRWLFCACLLSVLPLYGQHQAASAPAAPPAPAARGAALLASPPLHFEPVDTNTYAARGKGYTLAVSPAEAHLTAHGVTLQMQVAGADRHAVVTPEQPLGGVSHYLLGPDAAQWRRAVPHYGRVRVSQIYTGIDLLYYGNGRTLEYDFVVAPQAAPGTIRLRFDDAAHLALDPSGDLLLRTQGGTLRQKAPVSYQEIGGERVPVTSQYALLGPHEVGFTLGTYDRTRPLTIDPRLEWSTYFGGTGGSYSESGLEDISDLALDATGNIYITGWTTSANLPGWTGTAIEQRALFVSKLNPSATNVLYTAYFGVANITLEATAIAVDAAGNAYVAANFQASAGSNPGLLSLFAPGTPGVRPTPLPANGGLVFKLNPQGSGVLYSSVVCSLGCNAASLALRGTTAPVAHVAGSLTATSQFTPSASAQQGQYGGGAKDAYLSVLNETGTAVTYATYLGGTGEEFTTRIAVDANTGTSAVVGFITWSPQDTVGFFPTTPGAPQTQPGPLPRNGPTRDGFVTIYDGALQRVYSSLVKGQGEDRVSAAAFGPNSSLYLAGSAYVEDFPVTPGAYRSSGSLWAMQLTAGTWARAYSTFIDPVSLCSLQNACKEISDIALVGAELLLVGTPERDAPLATAGAIQSGSTTSRARGDAFLARLSADGRSLPYATILGGSLNDRVSAVAVDQAGNAVLAGFTVSPDFPIQIPSLQPLPASADPLEADGWLAKIVFDQTVCNVVVTFSQQSFSTAGGSGQIQITAPPGCVWQVDTPFLTNRPVPTPAPSWLTFGSPIRGVGNGTVAYTVSPNQANSMRNIVVLVGNTEVTLTQESMSSCVVNVTSIGLRSFPKRGGGDNVELAGVPSCLTSATNGASWIVLSESLIQLDSLTGTATVSYIVTPNLSAVTRTATITVAGQAIMIEQSGAEPVAPPATENILPFAGQGTSQLFTATWSDPDGWNDLASVTLQMGPTIDAINTCRVEALPEWGQLRLLADNGVSWLGPLQLNGSGTLANSQCTLDVQSSSANATGTRYTVSFSIRFAPAYTTRLNLFLWAVDQSGRQAPRRTLGTWWPQPQPAQAVNRYRLYSPVTRGHLYTTDLNEYTVLGASGSWRQEGVTGKALDRPGAFAGVAAVPFYRIYKEQSRTHFWTTDRNEYLTLTRLTGIYTGEGIDGFVLPSAAPGAVPLYRLAHQFEVPVLHHWTTDSNEYNVLPDRGWRQEGIAGYLLQP